MTILSYRLLLWIVAAAFVGCQLAYPIWIAMSYQSNHSDDLSVSQDRNRYDGMKIENEQLHAKLNALEDIMKENEQLKDQARERLQQPTPENNIFPSSVLWKGLPEKKEGYGVVLSAYSFDTEKSLPRFMEEATVSARKLKANNPDVSVAIITNASPKTVAKDAFDYIIPVTNPFLFKSESTRPDGVFRQWFSRLYYLAHSPYKITWYLDSHADVPTTRLLEAMKAFEQSDIDIATANDQPNGFYCHNFAMLFRWNTAVKHLFVDWLINQLQLGIDADDQAPLCAAMACSPDIKFGAIQPEWALGFLSLNWGKNNVLWRHRTTQVLRGIPHVCHHPIVCEVGRRSGTALANGTATAVLYMDSEQGISSARFVHSQEEMNKILPYEYKWNDWSPRRSGSPNNSTLLPHDVVIPKQLECKTPFWMTSPTLIQIQGGKTEMSKNKTRKRKKGNGQ